MGTDTDLHLTGDREKLDIQAMTQIVKLQAVRKKSPENLFTQSGVGPKLICKDRK
ncbi:hypothetical protein DPMN_048276 [Dreissena polymorpha]|uniref:Uncharacterized protein n=1 Tax=Dreissena polymorpha TaxID=45954 RepID=A0A9D4I3U6_DREPO|nr:hypothetical protein DPMN_048276 [Dreissena polymorpha]